MKNILRIAFLYFVVNSSLMAEIIQIEGSSTILPIMVESDTQYFKKNGISLSIKGGGSTEGVECLLEQKCQIGMVARVLNEKEKAQGIQAHLIGYDGIAVIVNKNNPISNISTQKIQDIYSGKINNWKELDGHDHEIFLIAKRKERSTRELFDKYFNIQKLDEDIEYVGSNIEDILMVALQEHAICYVSIGSAQHAINSGVDIKMLQLDGIAPMKEGKINNTYPFLHPLNLATYGELNADVQKIISTMTSDIEKKIILNHILIPIEEISHVK